MFAFSNVATRHLQQYIYMALMFLLDSDDPAVTDLYGHTFHSTKNYILSGHYRESEEGRSRSLTL